MKSVPQNVSVRYSRNLLVEGRNSHFEIESVRQQIAKSPGGLPCGIYFVAEVKNYPSFEISRAEGASPEAAVSRALEAFGVTFA
jgi:hypothetical protein